VEKILIITGATATGKTAFAIECAKLLNGEIISCDSMQIYRNLDIGTAKPTLAEQQSVPHYLINVVDANKEFSVQQFVNLAQEKITDIISRGKLPIIVGGTGLYIRALIYPYSFCSSQKNEQVREKLNDILNKKGATYLYSMLKEVDNDSAIKIHPNDTKKVMRALEIFETTGVPKSKQNVGEDSPRYDYEMIALTMPREILYERINNRVDLMFKMGLENEISALLKAGKVSRNSQSMSAIGYKEFFDYFDKKITLDEVKQLIKQHSRNYAKRQETFIRGFKDTHWFDDKSKALEYIKEKFT
jgi:tRNA dimethylallyltransferase